MSSRRILVRGIPYRIDEEIGHGLHSLVYSGVDLRNGRPVAIKVINFGHGFQSVRADTESRRQSYWKEIRMLLYLQPLNPYVIRVFNHDHTNEYGVIIMEQGQTIRDLMTSYAVSRKPMPVDLIRQFWYQMVDAIYHMHQIGIVHGDCKPENFIQVGPDGMTLRLIDMGISFPLPPNVTSRLRTAAGTPGNHLSFGSMFMERCMKHVILSMDLDYVSPEMVNTRVGSSAYSKCGYKADVWALGVILFEMAFGFRPLTLLRNNEAKLRFLGRLRRDMDIPAHPDKQLRSVLKGCLRTDSKRRLSIDQVLNHPFLQSAF